MFGAKCLRVLFRMVFFKEAIPSPLLAEQAHFLAKADPTGCRVLVGNKLFVRCQGGYRLNEYNRMPILEAVISLGIQIFSAA